MREGQRMLTSYRAVWRRAPAVHFDVTFKNPFDAKRKGCGPVRVGAHISTDVEFIAVILPTSTLGPLFLKSQRRAVTQFHTRSASSAVAASPTPTTMRFWLWAVHWIN